MNGKKNGDRSVGEIGEETRKRGLRWSNGWNEVEMSYCREMKVQEKATWRGGNR